MLTTGICELTLETRDVDAMERFYCGVLGATVIDREGDRVWVAVGERTRLGLWTPGEKEFGDEGGRHVHFAFGAEPGSLDGLVERMGTRGMPVKGPVEHPGGDRSIYLEDPEGNVVEVWDFFERGEGAEQGTNALAKED